MAWFLEFKWRGEDAYYLLRERFKDPAVYSGPEAHWAGPDIVRVEVFKALGYFPTESSQHLSEYVPWFRKRSELMERFKLNNRLDTLKTMIEGRARSEEEMRPLDVAAMARTRSTLLRNGAVIETAVWDPGYNGRSSSLLVVHNPYGIRFKKDARIAQLVFFRINEVGEGYTGVYQNERLGKPSSKPRKT